MFRYICIIFRKSHPCTLLRLSEDDADVSKHVAVLTKYQALYIYCICVYVVHLLVWTINLILSFIKRN